MQQSATLEAFVRSAIDRAYYSAFLATRETISGFFDTNDNSALECMITMKSIIHEAVIRILEILDPTLANLMVSLRGQRNDSSYDLEKEIGIEDLNDSVNDADYMLKCQEDIKDFIIAAYNDGSLKPGWLDSIADSIRYRVK